MNPLSLRQPFPYAADTISLLAVLSSASHSLDLYSHDTDHWSACVRYEDSFGRIYIGNGSGENAYSALIAARESLKADLAKPREATDSGRMVGLGSKPSAEGRALLDAIGLK